MSSMATTSTAAHQWLRANIATALGLTTFNRVLTGENIPDSFVVVGAVHKGQQEWAGFGNGRRDERYTISCLVRVHQGPDASGTFDTAAVDSLYAGAWQYVNGIAALLTAGLTVNGVAGDPTLGGAVFFAQLVAADEKEPTATNKGGLEVAVEFDIACRAQVTK